MKIKKSHEYFNSAAEEKLSWILEHSTNIFYTHNLEGQIIFISPQIKTVLGYSQEEALIHWTEFLSDHPVNKDSIEYTTNAIKTGKPQPSYEIQLLHKNGKKVWLEVHEAPVIKDGKVIYLTGSLTDVTERKKSELKQEILVKLSAALYETLNTKILFSRIHDLLKESFQADNFFIALYNQYESCISFPYYANSLEKSPLKVPINKSKGLTQFLLENGEASLFSKADMIEMVKRKIILLQEPLPEQWLGIPLKTGSHVFGVMVLQSYNDNLAYSSEDLELLTFIGDEIALVIKQRQAEEQLLNSLQEKESLIKELYHRTNNNMQIIASMLMQKIDITNDKHLINSFQEIVNKIYSMSLVHQKLYEIKDLSRIKIKNYIVELCDNLNKLSNDPDCQIDYSLDIKDLVISIDTAIPLGLVLTELITNAFQHAFPDSKKGIIDISLTQADKGEISLNFSDNGVGLSDSIDLQKLDSMGLNTVFAIVKFQLKGKIEYESSNGLAWKIKFIDQDKSRLIQNYFTNNSLQEKDFEIKKLNDQISELQKTKEDLKNATLAYAESEDKFNAISQNSPLAIMVYQNDHWVFANKTATTISGYSNQELMKMKFWDFVHPDFIDKVKEQGSKRQNFDKSKKNYEFKIITKQGKERWVWLNGSSTLFLGKPAGIITVQDISSRKKVENDLKESEERFKFLTKATFEGIIVHQKGFVLDVNDSFLKITGYSRKEVIGQKFLDYIPFMKDRAKILFNVVKQTAKPYVITAKRKDGTYFPAELEATNVKYRGKTVRIAALRDITDRLKAEQQLKLVHDRLQNMYSILRHDIANDLLVMQSALELYQENLDPAMLAEIEKRIDKCADVIKNQQKLAANLHSNKILEKIRLDEIIKSVADNYDEINFHWKSDKECLVYGDQRISSIFENLFSNSIRHGNATDIFVEVSQQNNSCQVRFADNGSGIPDRIKARIFDEGYHFGKSGNTGIGLYLVRTIIEDYGGFVTVENNYPKGTAFILNFNSE